MTRLLLFALALATGVVAASGAPSAQPAPRSPGAAGLGLRMRLPAMPSLALRLESYVSFAGETHGTTIPTFLGGELWF